MILERGGLWPLRVVTESTRERMHAARNYMKLDHEFTTRGKTVKKNSEARSEAGTKRGRALGRPDRVREKDAPHGPCIAPTLPRRISTTRAVV